MTRRSDDERFAVGERCPANFVCRVGMAEVDCHITIFHPRLDWIAQIAACGDLNVPIGVRQLEHSFSHASRRADEQYAHRRILHGGEQRVIASIQSLPGSCADVSGSLRSFRPMANEPQATSRRASRALS